MITGIKPNVTKERRYSVPETYTLLGINRKTLMKYTERQQIIPIIHSANNRMYYTGEEILRFWNAVS